MWQRSSKTTILIEITTEQQPALRVVLIAWFGVLGLIFWWHSETSLGTSSFQNLILSWKPSTVEFLYSPKMINLLVVLSYAGHSCLFSGFGFLKISISNSWNYNLYSLCDSRIFERQSGKYNLIKSASRRMGEYILRQNFAESMGVQF